MDPRRRLVVCFLMVMILPRLVPAQQKRAMTPVDMVEVPQLNDPQLSPDGRQLLFVLAKADWQANRSISHIWRCNADGSGLVQMTSGSNGESSPRWSPDGTRFAFLARRETGTSTRDETAGNQIFVVRNDGGEAQPLSRHATAVSNIAWSPDGRLIYFLASDPKTKEERERERLKDDVFAFDEDYKHTHLWTISVGDGKESKVTDGAYSVVGYALSRDGTKIVFSQAPSPLLGDRERAELYVMESSGSGKIRLTRNEIAESDYALSPDNTEVLFTAGANARFETYYDSNLFVVSANGGPSRLLAEEIPYGVSGAAWSRDGSAIYMICNMGVHDELFQLDPSTGRFVQWTDGEHALGDWTFHEKNDLHVLTRSDPSSPGEIYLLKTGDSKLQQVSRVFEYLSRDFELPAMEAVRWQGEDDVSVEGVLTYPLGYQEGRRYPLVVITHGGPRSADKLRFSSWSRYLPVLAGKGYAVLQPNYRGSTGYGDDFMRDMVGHYFNQAHRDVMAGVDYLIERGIADPDRMVKMGWSAGGHMTNKIITFTDRFKAAASGAGAANWISMYAQSDVRANRTPWFGGTPWQKDAPIEVYWDNSQLKDAWRVTTPTIFLVGQLDERVPMPQSVEMYRALHSNGVPTHLYVAPREPHGWRELRHQLFKINIELDWFEKHALGREYTWAKPPGGEPSKPEP